MNFFSRVVSLLNNFVAGRPLKKRKKRRGKRLSSSGRRQKMRRISRRVSSRIRRPAVKKAKKKIPTRRADRRKSLPRKKTPSLKKAKKKILAGSFPKAQRNKVLLKRADKAIAGRQAAVRPARLSKPALSQPGKALFVGEITHYFSKIMVCVVAVKDHPLTVGRKIRIEGKTAGFTQAVKSLQVESVDVRVAKKGQLVGLKVTQPVKEGDKVYLV